MPLFAGRSRSYDEYPDDVFKDSRMSFGDHLDELRTRMLRALKYLMIVLLGGFALDGLGMLLHNPNIGLGRPMFSVITEPVEQQVRDFYYSRTERVGKANLDKKIDSGEDEIARIREKLKKNDYNLSALSSEEQRILLGAPETMNMTIDTESLAPAFGPPRPDAPKELDLKVKVYPAYINYLSSKGEGLLQTKKYLSTMSFQEAFIVYFKVALLCSFVLASPFIFYQFWAFVGAGLYPHEKRYIKVFFIPSVALFLIGVIFCQFVVMPRAINALLGFNSWLDLDADIRLKEWLGLAILLPLVFGLSFQTPLVMVFLNRIGVFSAKDYLAKWRYACFIIVVITYALMPTPDVITPLYLFVPMFGLYMGGVLVCYLFPATSAAEAEVEAAEEVAV